MGTKKEQFRSWRWARNMSILFFILPVIVLLTLAKCTSETSPPATNTPGIVQLDVTGSSSQQLLNDVRAKYRFFLVEFTINNKAKQTAYISEADFHLIDRGGHRYQQSETGLQAYVRGDESLIFRQRPVVSGGSQEAIAIFDLPEDAQGRAIWFRQESSAEIPIPRLTYQEVTIAVSKWLERAKVGGAWKAELPGWIRDNRDKWVLRYSKEADAWRVSFEYFFQGPTRKIGETISPSRGDQHSSSEVVMWLVDDSTKSVFLRSDPAGFFAK